VAGPESCFSLSNSRELLDEDPAAKDCRRYAILRLATSLMGFKSPDLSSASLTIYCISDIGWPLTAQLHLVIHFIFSL
jgi:hypothetical protein